jgi:hypothetical protein
MTLVNTLVNALVNTTVKIVANIVATSQIPPTAFGICRWFKVVDFDLFFGPLFLVLHFRCSFLGCLLFVLRQ